MTDKNSEKNSFLEELRKHLPPGHSQMVLNALLAKHAGSSVYIPTEPKAYRRINVALNMLKNGCDGGEIVSVLRSRFNISARQAWRDVNSARQMS